MFIGRLNCLFLSLCILHLSMLSDGRPLRKRSVTEVQLMHNQGMHKHVHERQDWLNKRLQNIHAVTSSRGNAERAAAPDKTQRERRLLPGETGHHDLKDLTPEEMEFALSFLDRLLDSKN